MICLGRIAIEPTSAFSLWPIWEGKNMLAEAIGNIGQGTRTDLGWKDDSSLVEAAKQGDRVAFEILVGRHERMIFLRALRVTGNHEDAEDVVQQSFQKAFVHLNDFEGRSSFSTWLTRIALNEALMLRRKCWKWREVSMEEPNAGEETCFAAEIADSGPDPEHRYSQQEWQRLLFAAIDELRPGMRSVLHICDLGERSIGETAEILGLSAGAVKSRVNRARKVLRDKLNRQIEVPVQANRASAREPKRVQRPN
jgi:RNA polymerase sigma-70 factor (ECF subfamily)